MNLYVPRDREFNLHIQSCEVFYEIIITNFMKWLQIIFEKISVLLKNVEDF